MDWGLIGAGIASAVTGAVGWFAGKGKREAGNAASAAETELYKTLREEIAALHTEIVRLRNYVNRLERAMRDGGLELPSLDEKAGGTD